MFRFLWIAFWFLVLSALSNKWKKRQMGTFSRDKFCSLSFQTMLSKGNCSRVIYWWKCSADSFQVCGNQNMSLGPGVALSAQPLAWQVSAEHLNRPGGHAETSSILSLWDWYRIAEKIRSSASSFECMPLLLRLRYFERSCLKTTLFDSLNAWADVCHVLPGAGSEKEIV